MSEEKESEEAPLKAEVEKEESPVRTREPRVVAVVDRADHEIERTADLVRRDRALQLDRVADPQLARRDRDARHLRLAEVVRDFAD